MSSSNNSALLEQSDYVTDFGEEENQAEREKKFVHPIAVFFHIFFRASALLAYLLCGWFSSSFITNFIVVVLLLSMDFWTVKNITGRLLVGLRWWNYVDESGQSRWVYESRKGSGSMTISGTESRVFWLALVICQVLWCILFIGAIFRFSLKWLMLVIVGFLMNGANLYGYVRCKVGAKKNMSSIASSFLSMQIFRSMISSSTQSTTLNRAKETHTAASDGDKQ